MSRKAGEEAVLQLFDALSNGDITPIEKLSSDSTAALAAAREALIGMLPTMAYVDDPESPMASNLFFCAIMLAYFKPLREEGATAHEFGSLMLEVIDRQSPVQEPVKHPGSSMVNAAAQSNESAKPGEFVFDVIEDPEGADWGMNIKSCAICHLFSQHDAMDLVPYMCASDDVISDKSGQGLERTGTIALGASHCDFRFGAGREGRHLVDQYPERIQVRQTDG